MKDTLARITEIIADLNGIINSVSDNDTLEFDTDIQLSKIEVNVETLSNEVEETIEFARETST